MSFTDEVADRFTTWASRNVQALRAPSAQMTEAVAIGVAEVQEVFGTPGDDLDDDGVDFLETDVLMINRAFLEAVKWLKVMAPFEITSDMEAMIARWDKEKERLKRSRKQQENKPVTAERDHSRVDELYPFGNLPWDGL